MLTIKHSEKAYRKHIDLIVWYVYAISFLKTKLTIVLQLGDDIKEKKANIIYNLINLI